MLNKELKEMLTAEFCQVWHKDSKMVSYCVNKVNQVAILPNGEIITIDKQAIEKDFCFGESGYDYDDAAAMARHAESSVEYFTRENMKYFNEWIADLEKALDDLKNDNLSDSVLVINPRHYFSQGDACRLANISFIRWFEVIEACGGSCYIKEIPGREIEYRGQRVRIATAREIEIILEAYKAARADHEKRVKSYLKKYGLSKVRAWIYWRDA